MCGSNNPATAEQLSRMQRVAISTQAAGSLLKAAATFANSSNEKRAAKANAAYAEAQALDAKRRGEQGEHALRRDAAQLRGRQTASFAARGVALNEGSPFAVLRTTDVMVEADAATIRENAAREAYGHRVQAANYRAEAQAKNPWLLAGSSLLSDAGQVADRWYQYRGGQQGEARAGRLMDGLRYRLLCLACHLLVLGSRGLRALDRRLLRAAQRLVIEIVAYRRAWRLLARTKV